MTADHDRLDTKGLIDFPMLRDWTLELQESLRFEDAGEMSSQLQNRVRAYHAEFAAPDEHGVRQLLNFVATDGLAGDCDGVDLAASALFQTIRQDGQDYLAVRLGDLVELRQVVRRVEALSADQHRRLSAELLAAVVLVQSLEQFDRQKVNQPALHFQPAPADRDWLLSFPLIESN